MAEKKFPFAMSDQTLFPLSMVLTVVLYAWLLSSRLTSLETVRESHEHQLSNIATEHAETEKYLREINARLGRIEGKLDTLKH